MFRSLPLVLTALVAVHGTVLQGDINAPGQQKSQFYNAFESPAASSGVFTESGKSGHQDDGAPASPTPQFFSFSNPSAVPQAAPHAGVPSTSHHASYVAVQSEPQPGQYVAVQQAPQPVSYVGVQQAGQPTYIAVQSGPQPTQYIAVQQPAPQPQDASYVGVQQGQQQPTAFGPGSSAPQPGSFTAVKSAPSQETSFVAVKSAQGPSQHVLVQSAPQPNPHALVQSAPQPAPFVAVKSAAPHEVHQYVAGTPAHQPSTFVDVSPKFNSAPASVVPSTPSASYSATFGSVSHASQQAQVKSGVLDKDAHIISEGRSVSHDGTFDFGFNTENGISVQSKGYIKPAASPTDEPIQVIEGSYQYVDGFGKLQTISYIADENGYRAFGDSIPQPHEVILKALAHHRR